MIINTFKAVKQGEDTWHKMRSRNNTNSSSFFKDFIGHRYTGRPYGKNTKLANARRAIFREIETVEEIHNEFVLELFRLGNEGEDWIKTLIEFEEPPYKILDIDEFTIGVSPDGLFKAEDGTLYPIEIKTKCSERTKPWKGPLAQYCHQGILQAIAMGVDKSIFLRIEERAIGRVIITVLKWDINAYIKDMAEFIENVRIDATYVGNEKFVRCLYFTACQHGDEINLVTEEDGQKLSLILRDTINTLT